MTSQPDAAAPHVVMEAIIIWVLREFIRRGHHEVTVTEIAIAVASAALNVTRLQVDPTWIEPVLRDLIERKFLTLLRSPHQTPIVGYTTTNVNEVNFAKARLRIHPSILSATAIPNPPQQININHGEQFFGSSSKFVEINNQAPSADSTAGKSPPGDQEVEEEKNTQARLKSLEQAVKRKKTAKERIRDQRNKFSCPRRSKPHPDTWQEIYQAYSKQFPEDKTASAATLRLSHDRHCQKCSPMTDS